MAPHGIPFIAPSFVKSAPTITHFYPVSTEKEGRYTHHRKSAVTEKSGLRCVDLIPEVVRRYFKSPQHCENYGDGYFCPRSMVFDGDLRTFLGVITGWLYEYDF